MVDFKKLTRSLMLDRCACVRKDVVPEVHRRTCVYFKREKAPTVEINAEGTRAGRSGAADFSRRILVAVIHPHHDRYLSGVCGTFAIVEGGVTGYEAVYLDDFARNDPRGFVAGASKDGWCACLGSDTWDRLFILAGEMRRAFRELGVTEEKP